MIDTNLPDSQFDPVDQRDNSSARYSHALKMVKEGKYLERNLDHMTIAMDIRHIAKCVESIGDIGKVDYKLLLGSPSYNIFFIKEDGTWNGYRQYILSKYNIDMGEVPADAEKPSLAKIEGTIQNWLNGEPLLFY